MEGIECSNVDKIFDVALEYFGEKSLGVNSNFIMFGFFD